MGIIIRAVVLSEDLDTLVEETRRKLGFNRSAFFKYAVVRLLQELSVLTERVHEEVSG